MRRAATIDPASLAILYDRHSACCYALARRMLGEGAAADKVVRGAFLGLWRLGSSFDAARGSVRSQLLESVRTRAIEALRGGGGSGLRHASSSVREEDALRAARSPDEEVMGHGLPSELWVILQLAYFDGLTEDGIARRLDLPLEEVKLRARQALDRLAERDPDSASPA